MTLRALLAGLVLLAAAPVLAEEDPHELYKRATAHFNLGRFKEAAVEYERLFEGHPDPVLLYNIAQCYRLAGGADDKALFFYKSYLQRAPKAKNRPEVEERIASLEKLVAAQKKAQEKPPNSTAPLEPAPASPTVTTTMPKPPEDQPTPIYKKWWLWTIVGVAAAGIAVGLGVGLTAAPPKFNPNLGEGGPGSSAALHF